LPGPSGGAYRKGKVWREVTYGTVPKMKDLIKKRTKIGRGRGDAFTL